MRLLANKTSFWHTANIKFAVCLVLSLTTAFSSRAQQRISLYFPESEYRISEAVDSTSRLIADIGPENIEAVDVAVYNSPEELYREHATQFERLLNDRYPVVPVNVQAEDRYLKGFEIVIRIKEPQPVKKKPVLAISTNIPYDITYIPKYGLTSIPSFSLEYYPSKYGHWTFGADLEIPMWQHWDQHRFMQIQNLTLNTRYYFKRGHYHGLYLLANVYAARYGIGWDAKGWEGEGLGISAGIGYKLTIYKRLFLDAGIAVGYFYSRYDPYEYGFDSTQKYYYDYVGVPEEFVRRNHVLNWFGPTRVWIAIGFELFSRKTDK